MINNVNSILKAVPKQICHGKLIKLKYEIILERSCGYNKSNYVPVTFDLEKDGNNYADTILITVNEEGILSLDETNVVLMSASLVDDVD